MKQRLWVLVASLLCCAVTSLAQAPTAVVNGQVRDSSGAAIPSAAVCGWHSTSAISCSGELGTPASSSCLCHSALGRSIIIAAISFTSSA